MKKLISLLLAMVMIVCALPLQSFAVYNDYEIDMDELEEIGDELNDKIFGLDFLEKIKIHDADVQADYLKQMNLLKMQNSISFVKGFSSVLGLVNGVYSLLKNIGVIKNGSEVQFKNILNTLSEIKKVVNEIDKKADTIEKTLVSEFSKIDVEFGQLKYDSYQKAWSDFFTVGAYKDMNDIIAAYNSQVNTTLLKYAKSWQTGTESGIRALYNGDFDILVFSGDNMDGVGEEISSRPRWSDDDDSYRINSSITLPGNYIKIGNVALNADNYQEYLENAVTSGVSAAIKDGKLEASDSFYTEWNLLTNEEKTSRANTISKQLMDSLHYEVIHSVANSSKSGKGTFASEIKAKYDLFCNTLYGTNDITSPIVAAYNKLTAIHAFEGEIFGDLIAYTALMGTLCVQYGTYATMITALDESMSSAKKEDTERNKTVSYNYVLYMLDNFLTGYDNYCYPLKGLVEYHDAYLLTEIEAVRTGLPDRSFKTTIPWTVVDTTEYKVSDTREEKDKAVNEMKGLLSVRDISLLYYYYLFSGLGGDFLTYLGNYSAVKAEKKDDKYNTALITNDYKAETLPIDGKFSMVYHGFGYARWPYTGNEGKPTTLCKETSIEKYYGNQKVIGTLFNVASGSAGAGSADDVKGRIILNHQLGRMAIRHYFSDEMSKGAAVFYTDGEFLKACSMPGSNEIGTDDASFKNATYTVATGYNYGALVVKPLPAKNEEGEKTASVFSNGKIALISGGAVLALAVGFGCGYGISKKKKSKATEA